MTRAERAAIHAALGDESRLAVVEALALTDASSAALAGLLGLPTNLLAHHLAILEGVGLIERRNSDGDGRLRYIRLKPDRLPGPLSVPVIEGDVVLFACSRNSARSQLASVLFRRRTGRDAHSAGSKPAPAVHPRAHLAAEEVGLRLPTTTNGYDDVPTPDILVTVCDLAKEEPPPFEATVRLHWSIPDPVADGRMGAFRAARDELEHRIDLLARAMTHREENT